MQYKPRDPPHNLNNNRGRLINRGRIITLQTNILSNVYRQRLERRITRMHIPPRTFQHGLSTLKQRTNTQTTTRHTTSHPLTEQIRTLRRLLARLPSRKRRPQPRCRSTPRRAAPLRTNTTP